MIKFCIKYTTTLRGCRAFMHCDEGSLFASQLLQLNIKLLTMFMMAD